MSCLITKTFTFEGKRYYVRAKTEKECLLRLARRQLELEEGIKRIDKNTLYSVWIDEWIAAYKSPAVSKSWLKTISAICSNIILPDVGKMMLKNIKPLHLQKILNKHTDKSQSYLRKIYNVMHESLETARKNGLINENPADAVVVPQGKKKKPRRSITAYEREHILKVAATHRAGPFIMIMLFCGLRPGEVAALLWKDVDFKNKVIKVNKALKKDGIIGEPKSAAGNRTVPAPDKLIDFLRPLAQDPFENVCTNASGGQLTETTIRRMWQTFTYNLNISMGCKTFRRQIVPPFRVAEDLTLYCLRHTYCTDLQAAGIPINVARELMGHADISVTAQIYTHGSEESFESARDKLNELIEKRAVAHDVAPDAEIV